MELFKCFANFHSKWFQSFNSVKRAFGSSTISNTKTAMAYVSVQDLIPDHNIQYSSDLVMAQYAQHVSFKDVAKVNLIKELHCLKNSFMSTILSLKEICEMLRLSSHLLVWLTVSSFTFVFNFPVSSPLIYQYWIKKVVTHFSVPTYKTKEKSWYSPRWKRSSWCLTCGQQSCRSTE